MGNFLCGLMSLVSGGPGWGRCYQLLRDADYNDQDAQKEQGVTEPTKGLRSHG